MAQPHDGKSVTTELKDFGRVHSCISRKTNNGFSSVCLGGSTQRLKCAFVANLTQCTQILSVACGREWDYSTLRAAELTGLSSESQKPRKPRRYAPLVQVLQVKYVEGLHSFICGRWSKFYIGSSYFAVKYFPGDGGAGAADRATTGEISWLRWCHLPFTCRRISRLHRFVLAQISRSKRKTELRKPENEQIRSAVHTHSWPVLLRIESR